jgi:hypothetical protein
MKGNLTQASKPVCAVAVAEGAKRQHDPPGLHAARVRAFIDWGINVQSVYKSKYQRAE